MTITSELDLSTFKFWSGAKDFADKLTYTELQDMQNHLEDLYPDGMTETHLNDLFWFEDEFICQCIGLDLDEVCNRE